MENKTNLLKDDELKLSILDFCRTTEFQMDESDIEKVLQSDELEKAYFYSLLISFLNKEGFTAKKLTAKSRRYWSKTFAQLSVEAIESFNRKDDLDDFDFNGDNDDFDFEEEPVEFNDQAIGAKIISKRPIDYFSQRIESLTRKELMDSDHPNCDFIDNVINVLNELEKGGVLKFPESISGYDFSYEIMSANHKEKTKYLLLVAHKVSASELLHDYAKLPVLKMINLILSLNHFSSFEFNLIKV
uniref:Uncharacterized protein n=1 Tax=Rhizophagus irregularis (strain DAOM 181602 / DAOM 197198 / MUCL 43194) TaxID=747089 RepID=U9TD30_RHIID